MPVHFTEEEVLGAVEGHLLRSARMPLLTNVCTDTRALTRGCLFVALEGERFDAHAFVAQAAAAGAGAALVARGRTLPETPDGFGLYVVENTLEALGQLAHVHRRRFSLPVGAVGGSNGKTTAKEMVGAILETRGPALKTEGNFNNEIGVPLTLFRLAPEHVAAVVELGMNHAGEMTRLTAMCEPDAALLTVIQPEHLEGLGSLEGVAAAEGELFEGLAAGTTAVVNLDDPHLVTQARRTRATQLTFGRHPHAAVRLIASEPRGRVGQWMDVAYAGGRCRVALPFLGAHNALNATGAFALGVALGYPMDACVAGLEAARPYARRLNVLEAPGEITVLDDCYNANPASMQAALETLETLVPKGAQRVAVLGDMLELGLSETEDHAALGAFAREHTDVVAYFGPRSLAAFRAHGERGQVRHFDEIGPLLAWLTRLLHAGDVVLVKASRGMRLERVVEALTAQAPGKGH